MDQFLVKLEMLPIDVHLKMGKPRGHRSAPGVRSFSGGANCAAGDPGSNCIDRRSYNAELRRS
jgi:hypothetical protein